MHHMILSGVGQMQEAHHTLLWKLEMDFFVASSELQYIVQRQNQY